MTRDLWKDRSVEYEDDETTSRVARRARQAARILGEGAQIPLDCDLLGKLEGMEELFRWERELLEKGSERVYSNGRALLADTRTKLEEILHRRTGQDSHE